MGTNAITRWAALTSLLGLVWGCAEPEASEAPATVTAAAPSEASPAETCRAILEHAYEARAEERQLLENTGARPYRLTLEEYVANGRDMLGVCQERLSEEQRSCLVAAADPWAADCELPDAERSLLMKWAPDLFSDWDYVIGAAPGRARGPDRRLDEDAIEQRMATLAGTWRHSNWTETWTIDRSGVVDISTTQIRGWRGRLRMTTHRATGFNLTKDEGEGESRTTSLYFFPASEDIIYVVFSGPRAIYQPVASRTAFLLEYRHDGWPSERFLVDYRESGCRALDLAGFWYEASCRFEDVDGEELFHASFTPRSMDEPVTATYAVTEDGVFINPETRWAGRLVRQ